MSRTQPVWRRKWVLIPLGVLLLLAAAAALLFAFGLDPYARRFVERLAAGALRVPVRIDRADIRLRGRSALTGISIMNPPGYQDSEAARFDRLDGYLEAGSISRSTIEMHDLVLVHPVVTVDYLDGRSNISVLITNLAGDPVDPQAVPPTSVKQSFHISRVRVIDGVLRFRSSDAAGGFITILLPDLQMDDFGDAPGAEPSTAKVLTVVLEAMVGSGIKAEDTSIPTDARWTFLKELRKLTHPGK